VGVAIGVGVGGLKIVKVAALRLPKTAFLGRLRLRLTVRLLVAVVRIGILKVWLGEAFVNVNVPVVVV
jgi:hypothetical protein